MEKVNEKNEKNLLPKRTGLFYFLLILILLRPSLDIISQYEFQIHSSLPYFNLNIIIGGLVFIIGLIFLLKNIKTISAAPLGWPVFVFLGLSLASIFYSVEPVDSFKEFIRLASIFLLYFLTFQLVKNEPDWQLLLKIILLSYVLPGSLALIQLITGQGLPDDFGGFNRIYGTFSHPNPFAFYTFFILGLVICLFLSLRAAKGDEAIPWQKHGAWFWPVAGILIFLLFATYTRTALACFFIFILLFGFFKYRKILLAGLLIFLAFYIFSDVFQQRFWELITLDPYGSVVWRLRLWRDIIPVSLWQPWFGYGAGTFNQLVEFYRGFSWGSLEAHNDYLKIFVENGLVGLMAYAWLLVALLFYLFKIFKKAIDQEKIMALGIFAICLSLFAASFFDNILRSTALQWNLWILLGGWLKIKQPRLSI